MNVHINLGIGHYTNLW